MPGIGLLIDGAMQQAAQRGRQAARSSGGGRWPAALSRNKTFRIAKRLQTGRFFANACPGHGVGMLMRNKINKHVLHNQK